MSFHLDSYGTDVGSQWRIQGKPNAVRFGIEIETGWASHTALQAFFNRMEAKHLDKYAVAKTDASIRASVGAEIVTRPLVFAECKRVAKRVLDCAMEGGFAEGEGDLDLRGCGVHVHTTRDAWDRSALLYAYAAVGYRPVQAFWDAIATRAANDYCNRNVGSVWGANGALNGTMDRNGAWNQWRAMRRHYDAVSWSGHEPTIEFRLFGATRKVRSLASYLDTVHALLSYGVSQVGGRDDAPIHWPEFKPTEFAAWVNAQPGYQALKWRLAHSKDVRAALRPARRSSRPSGRPVVYDRESYNADRAILEETGRATSGRGASCGESTRSTDDNYVCTRLRNHDGPHVATWGTPGHRDDFITSWNTTPEPY